MIHPVLWLFLGLASSPCIIARTWLVYTPSHFVAALADVTVDKVQVEVPLVALTEDVFQRSGVRVPVSINRTVTVVGSPQLPEWPMLQFMAWHTVELCAGVTLLFTNVIIQYYVLDSPARTPNLYLFAPSKAPNLGPNGTRVVLQAAVLILPSCLPVRLRNQNLVPVERPVWEGPGPQIAQLYPMKTSCSNSTDAPVLERCWQAGMLLQQDYAYPGAESASDGTVVANNVTLRFLDVSILCQQEVTDECLVSLGPYGCLVYVNRLMSAQPPVPISAQMRAIIAQQQQQAESGSVSMYAPAAGGVPASTTAEGGSGKPAVPAGAVAGGVAGAALLLAAAATAFLSYRRRKRLRPDKHHQGRLLKRAGPADVTGHCDSKRHQEGCGNTHSVVVFYGPDAKTDDSSSSYADSASSALTPAVPLPAAGGQGSPGPPGSQPQQHADASWRLPDLVVSSAPLRAGLETQFVVVSRGHAADAPADITAQSMAPGLPRSCAAGYGKQGAATPSEAPLTPCPHGFSRAAALVCEPQQHPQCRAEAAREGTEALRAHALFASTGSSTSTGDSAGTGSAAQPAAALTSTYASALAVLWLGSTNMESLLTASSGADPSPGPTENAATPPDFGDAARNTDAVVEPAAQVAVSVANEAAEVASKGTPAAAVSLLPPPLTLGEELPAPPVEVVELLPHRLGKGSFGRVLEGRYRGQRVAVKQALDLHDGLTLPVASVVASFLQEVQVMGRCTHPNITTLLAACLAPPKLCLVMELMDASLEALIFGGPPGHLLPLPKVLHIAIQMARGLEYLHPTVIHRDLKPSNVLISNPGDEHPIVKLTDFGLSKISETTLETAHPEAGTPAYLAPECFDITNNKLTHQVDMYAFAVCIWAMLTGEIPWKNHNVVSVAYNVHMGRRPPLDFSDDVRCPRKLRKLIEQCWDAEPRRRPAAAEAVKELLVVREQLLLLPSGN